MDNDFFQKRGKPYEELLISLNNAKTFTKSLIHKAIDGDDGYERDRLIAFLDKLKEWRECVKQFNAGKDIDYPPTDEVFFNCKKGSLLATGKPLKEGFLVRERSQASLEETPSCPESIKRIRRQLIKQGVLQMQTGFYEFARAHLFSSPSQASSVVKGTSTNGLINWKDPEGVPLKEFL